MSETTVNQTCQPCKLGIVVPCYNEEAVLATTINTLLALLSDLCTDGLVDEDSFLYIVDDGSSDKTFEIIQKFHHSDKRVKGLRLTKNFGNQNTILAGLEAVRELKVDAAVTIDADLQQDERVIRDFVLEYQKGNEIVFGIRQPQKKVGFVKKYTSVIFYKVMNFLGAEIVPSHSEYRLMGSQALNILAQYKEYSLFLRGLFNHMGLKSTNVTYATRPRAAGETKFNWGSLAALALNGITSFSIVPLRMVVILGFLMALASFAIGLGVVYERFVIGNTVPGWATIVVCVCFFSGIQIFCLGIIGEYLGQIFNEVKGRPRYIKEAELI
jgi:glycosyltransferase involved in cell wall biosynthesis